MRIRAILLTAAIALGVIAPAAAVSANPTICLDAEVNINGDQVVDESTCLPE